MWEPVARDSWTLRAVLEIPQKLSRMAEFGAGVEGGGGDALPRRLSPLLLQKALKGSDTPTGALSSPSTAGVPTLTHLGLTWQ